MVTSKRASIRAVASRVTRWLWEQRFRFPLTPLGLGLGLGAWWVYQRYGGEELDFVLYAAALVAFSLLGLTVLMVAVATLYLWLRLRGSRGVADLDLESGTSAATGFSFPRLTIWPLVQVRLEWADPPQVEAELAKARGRVQEVVLPRQRGERNVVRRRFVVTDIFGLARLGLQRRAPQRVRVLPGRARVSGRVIASFVGGEGLSHPSGPAEGELLDMRRYAPGDPLRLVLWKAFGRTRQLLVRSPERAIAPSPSVMAYFVAGPQDESSAATARFFLEQGLLGDDFTFGADGTHDLCSDEAAALTAIVRSVEARRRGGEGLGRFIDHADKQRQRTLLLFVPAAPGPWLEAVTRQAGRLRGATVVCAVDDLARAQRRGRLSRLFFADERRATRRAQRALPQVVERLTAAGVEARVLHRPSGELLATSSILGAAGGAR
ncbi:MAG: hypothetical protein CSA65_07175 [Proteobacteria bacterium]|nr:MAG: hypothetical protein CSB49_00650 [Pseudomonadota bacterium]PIE17929.1 MAG: hypothetical protein CSA65_07175 [Pseudomonadota bacterium]